MVDLVVVLPVVQTLIMVELALLVEGHPGAGSCPDNAKCGGGGGGAGQAGDEGSRDPENGGHGGGGVATGFPGPILAPAVPNPSDFSTAVGPTGIFAGGGGGGTHGTSSGDRGKGGQGGGGNSGYGDGVGIAGVNNTGSGGGGGAARSGSQPGPDAKGGDGGHGIVVIRYFTG